MNVFEQQVGSLNTGLTHTSSTNDWGWSTQFVYGAGRSNV